MITRRDLLKRIGFGAAGAAGLALVPYLPKGDPEPAPTAQVPAIIVPPTIHANAPELGGDKITMTGVDVYMNGVLVGHASEAVMRVTHDYVDATAFGDVHKTFLVGQRSQRIELTMASYPFYSSFYGSAVVSGYEA